MTGRVPAAEKVMRTLFVLGAFATLSTWAARPAFDVIWGLAGGKGGVGIAVLCLPVALYVTVVVGTIELSFAPRELADGLAGTVRRRHARFAAVTAWIGAASLLAGLGAGVLLSEGVGYPADHRQYQYQHQYRYWDAFGVILVAVSTALLAVLAAVLHLGIANRLAIRALERRRAGRDPTRNSTAGNPASARP